MHQFTSVTVTSRTKKLTVYILLDDETTHLTDYVTINNKYILIYLSLHMATVSAMSVTPHIVMHSTAISH